MPEVSRQGVEDHRPAREASPGGSVGDQKSGTGADGNGGRRSSGGRTGGEQKMVPKADFSSYYGLPILNGPVWHSPEIPGYLFLGGLAGASSVLAAGAQLTGRPQLARRAKLVAAGAVSVGGAALVKDLGRPSRFANMLRVLKPTSPMSVGSWILTAYGPAAAGAAGAALLGRFRRLGNLATAGAAVFGPPLATYTAALLCDTAVPAWHDGYPEMPLVFAGSSAMAAGGAGLLVAPAAESSPARRLAVVGAVSELVALTRMEQRLGLVAEPYHEGAAGRFGKAAHILTAGGVALALLGRRRRLVNAVAGGALLAASACTRFAIFEAGKQSAADPKYVVEPQRRRLGR
ncbi:MAG TPA: NrfD/PsrC family molybdoenzyme membrane anchor subunit [Acidimicrobiales bacterium]|nr:NrfD/PsrC family molybdoenzyme membrane anchor subunit [Acidimicrobiales bacterium]